MQQSPLADSPALYLTRRLVDAVIREDVAGCQSQSEVIDASSVPGAPTWPAEWLRWGLDRGTLWVPVAPARFMQRWRWSGQPMIWQAATAAEPATVDHYEQLLACLRSDTTGESRELLATYLAECRTAEAHHSRCQEERNRWFAEACQQGLHWRDLTAVPDRLLYFDRLAAFLDHPFYPSARAKSGFDDEALAAYGPEFAPRFQLRWLAVPRSDVTVRGRLPDAWPSFSDVGLNQQLADNHRLVPVHPHLWDTALDRFLAETPLGSQVLRAPDPYLWVRPTLSVRTLVLEAEPQVHVKVPLTIRTLGNRNIRTVKPSTLYDGHTIQRLLQDIIDNDQTLSELLAVTDESTGMHAGDLPWLGCIVRHLPTLASQQALVPVASLAADSPDGRCVTQTLADALTGGDLWTWVRHYLALTLRVHLRLWLEYGIALESNQQNSMLVLEPGQRPYLLLKDNDAPRIWPARLCQRLPSATPLLEQLKDRRILVDDETPLVQMFTTITLQLNLAVVLEGLADRGPHPMTEWYRLLRQELIAALDQLAADGVDTAPARQALLHDDRLFTKYLLRAGSLESKDRTGAADINKFYGKTAPNFLRLVP